MRIDLMNMAATTDPAEAGVSGSRGVQSSAQTQTVLGPTLLGKNLPAAPQAPEREVDVVVDDNQVRIYRFIDKQTGEVIVQLPPEEMLRVMRNIKKMLSAAEGKVDLEA
jgi:FlaG protein